MKIEIKGGTELQTALRGLGDPKAIRTALRAGLRKAAAPMLAAAKAGVPIDQGDLKRSVKIAAAKGERPASPQFGVVIGIDSNEQPAKMVVRKGGKGGTYRDPGVAGVGPIIEFGKPGEPARPFMRPAFDREGEATIQRFAQVAGPEIDRVAARLAKKRGQG
jgi:hypothetical protein